MAIFIPQLLGAAQTNKLVWSYIHPYYMCRPYPDTNVWFNIWASDNHPVTNVIEVCDTSNVIHVNMVPMSVLISTNCSTHLETNVIDYWSHWVLIGTSLETNCTIVDTNPTRFYAVSATNQFTGKDSMHP